MEARRMPLKAQNGVRRIGFLVWALMTFAALAMQLHLSLDAVLRWAAGPKSAAAASGTELPKEPGRVQDYGAGEDVMEAGVAVTRGADKYGDDARVCVLFEATQDRNELQIALTALFAALDAGVGASNVSWFAFVGVETLQNDARPAKLRDLPDNVAVVPLYGLEGRHIAAANFLSRTALEWAPKNAPQCSHILSLSAGFIPFELAAGWLARAVQRPTKSACAAVYASRLAEHALLVSRAHAEMFDGYVFALNDFSLVSPWLRELYSAPGFQLWDQFDDKATRLDPSSLRSGSDSVSESDAAESFAVLYAQKARVRIRRWLHDNPDRCN